MTKTQPIPGPACCPGCEAQGEKLAGFPRDTYECPRCGRIWHVAEGQKVTGFPPIGEADPGDLPYSPATLDFVYPPLQAEDLDFGLTLTGELITAGSVDAAQADDAGWVSPPSLADVEDRLPRVEITSYRAFMNAIRLRYPGARERFSLAERTLLLLGMARRGALGEWAQLDTVGDIRFLHPAVLSVVAATPYTELIRLSGEEFERAVRHAAEAA